MATEEKIGTVTDYYSRIGVAAIALTHGDLRLGDRIHIQGHTTDLVQSVDSLEANHQPVPRAERGSQIAVRVIERVRRHDTVLRVSET